MGNIELRQHIYRRIYFLGQSIPESDFLPRLEELIHLLENFKPKED